MSIVLVYDATHQNIAHLPAGRPAAGYTTGSQDIRWTDADWAAHPGAVRIDQDWTAVDTTADILDVERGAATNAEAAGWYRKALTSYKAATRPGQREPAIYTSASNVTALVNALKTAGVTSGPKLWVANWNLDEAQATADVAAASGPFPLVGVQFRSLQYYDVSVFSSAWLDTVSKPPAPVWTPGHVAHAAWSKVMDDPKLPWWGKLPAREQRAWEAAAKAVQPAAAAPAPETAP